MLISQHAVCSNRGHSNVTVLHTMKVLREYRIFWIISCTFVLVASTSKRQKRIQVALVYKMHEFSKLAEDKVMRKREKNTCLRLPPPLHASCGRLY